MKNYLEDYLAHHGIKGQRWGVRRYQNPDGSLTSLGKHRLGKDDRPDLGYAINKEVGKDYSIMSGGLKNASKAGKNSSEIVSRLASIRKRRVNEHTDVSEMSDSELRERINRMGLERQYKDLVASQYTTGYDYMQDILSIGASGLAATGSVLGIMAAIKQLKT